MVFFGWLLSLSILLTSMVQAVELHRATVCRQKAWLKSTELITKTVLENPAPMEKSFILSCRIYLERHHNRIVWKRLPDLTPKRFDLELYGKL